MYIRLQTWFPFEVQIGLNGREWLAQQLDRKGLKYQRSDNDVSFESRPVLQEWYERWVRHGFLTYDSLEVLRFLGRSRLRSAAGTSVQSDVQAVEESVRLKHWVNGNSLKMYDHGNVLRVETTINKP